jgi:excisionase family DNA binding protein
MQKLCDVWLKEISSNRTMTRNCKDESRRVTPDILNGRLMLRVREYAALTGTPAPSVYRYMALGKLPSIRIGGTLRIPVSAVTDQLGGVGDAK